MARDNERDERESLQLDLYGVKLLARPRAGDYVTPTSWASVWRAIHSEIRGIVANVFGLVGDVVKAGRNVVRGLGGLPAQDARAVRAAHDAADNAEVARATEAIAQAQSPDALRRLLQKKQVEGYSVRVVSDGKRLVFCILPPMDESEIETLSRDALNELAKSTMDESTGA
jgi:hypothetical protein